MLPVVFLAGMVPHKVEHLEVAAGIADHAIPLLELEQIEITIVIEDAFLEQFMALLVREREPIGLIVRISARQAAFVIGQA